MISHTMQLVQTAYLYPTLAGLTQVGCRLPQAEMIVRTLIGVPRLILHASMTDAADIAAGYGGPEKRKQISEDLVKDLSAALFYGFCVSVIPHGAVIGTICFIAYSAIKVAFSTDLSKEYITALLVGKPINWIYKHIVCKAFNEIGNVFAKMWSRIPMESKTAKMFIMASMLLITAATVSRVVIPIIIEHLG